MPKLGSSPDTKIRPAMSPVRIDVDRIFAQNDNWGSGEWNDVVSSVNGGFTPIVSAKLNNGWLSVAGGAENVRLDGIVSGCTGLNISSLTGKPRLAIHHEPEGDGTPGDYNALYKFLNARYGGQLRTKGWDLCFIFMGGTWLNQTKWTLTQLEESIAGVGLKDIFADCYELRGVDANGYATTTWKPLSDSKSRLGAYLRWCKSKGMNPALCEFAVAHKQSDASGSEVAGYFNMVAADADAMKAEFYCYYQRNKGEAGASVGNWRIDTMPEACKAFGKLFSGSVTPPGETDAQKIARLTAELQACKDAGTASDALYRAMRDARDALQLKVDKAKADLA